MATILLIVVGLVIYILVIACKESGKRRKAQKELSDKYIKFISEFNRVNGTHYSLYGNLNATFNKCLVDYIFTANYVLPFVPYENMSDITLANYNYRDMSKYKETNIYKLNECNLQNLIECQKKQDVKSFYNYLFAIPIKISYRL